MTRFVEMNRNDYEDINGGGLLTGFAGLVIGASGGFLFSAATAAYGLATNSVSGAEARTMIKAGTVGGASLGLGIGVTIPAP